LPQPEIEAKKKNSKRFCLKKGTGRNVNVKGKGSGGKKDGGSGRVGTLNKAKNFLTGVFLKKLESNPRGRAGPRPGRGGRPEIEKKTKKGMR